MAETAKLLASLELQDKFSQTVSRFDHAVSGMERGTRRIGVAGVAVGTALGQIGARAVSAGIRTLVSQVTEGIDALNELQSVSVATDTVLTSTGGVAGVTADQVRNLAEKYEGLNATINDKVIQSGENLLLTFTNIRGEAFEPALQAALDMNEAMGGGEEGLQSTIIQLGKALQDPVKGFTSLKRVGVNLSEAQQQQIKDLVKQNDLYGAQRVILDELATEFGGRFTAAGKTAEGQQAALRDKIEDVQKALAGPLIPALSRAREKLIALLDSPAVMQGAENLGKALAGLFSEQNLDRAVGLIKDAIDALSGADFSGVTGTFSTIASSVANLPWGAIGDAARLLGTGSKALLDAFTSLPPWIQTAVLTGWGLNKLTGGALSGIVGTLASGLIKGILGINAGVVNVNAAMVNGGVAGVPTATGGGVRSIIGGAAKFVLGPAAAIIIGSEIAAAINAPVINPSKAREEKAVKAVLDSKDAARIASAINAITEQQNTSDVGAQVALIASNIPFIGDALGHVGPELEEQRKTLLDQLKAMGLSDEHIQRLLAQQRALAAADAAGHDATRRAVADSVDATHAEQRAVVAAIASHKEQTARVAAQVRDQRTVLNESRLSLAGTARHLAGIERVSGTTAANTGVISRKNFSPTLQARITVNNTVSVSDVVRAVTSHSIAVGVRGGLPEGV